NFAGFMHLADHDDALVGGRIWTDSEHIETRLTDLTEHMETVIQKYLRNEFETIDDYNAQAGELAEAHRFLVIADLPVDFSDGPPSEEVLNDILDVVGRGAKDSKRVEVPFDSIAPQANQFWSLSTKDELRVPIGRLGATRLQMLRLGRGVAQHALIAGKTGSG